MARVDALAEARAEAPRLLHQLVEATAGEVLRGEQPEQRSVLRRQRRRVHLEVAGGGRAGGRRGLEEPQSRAGGQEPVGRALRATGVQQHALGRPAFGVEPRQRRGARHRRDHQHRPSLEPGEPSSGASGPALELVAEGGEHLAPVPAGRLAELGEARPARAGAHTLAEQVLGAEALDHQAGDSAAVEPVELLRQLADRHQVGEPGQALEDPQEVLGAHRADRPAGVARTQGADRSAVLGIVGEQEERHLATVGTIAPGASQWALVDHRGSRDLYPADHVALGDATHLRPRGAHARDSRQGVEQLARVHGPKRPGTGTTRG